MSEADDSNSGLENDDPTIERLRVSAEALAAKMKTSDAKPDWYESTWPSIIGAIAIVGLIAPAAVWWASPPSYMQAKSETMLWLLATLLLGGIATVGIRAAFDGPKGKFHFGVLCIALPFVVLASVAGCYAWLGYQSLSQLLLNHGLADDLPSLFSNL